MALVWVARPTSILNDTAGEGFTPFLRDTYPAFTGRKDNQNGVQVFQWDDTVAPVPTEVQIETDHAAWLVVVRADAAAKQARKDFARDNKGVGGLPSVEAQLENLIEVLQDLGVIPT